jgi:hypothetical protein
MSVTARRSEAERNRRLAFPCTVDAEWTDQRPPELCYAEEKKSNI